MLIEDADAILSGILEEFLRLNGKNGYQKSQADEFDYAGTFSAAGLDCIHRFRHRRTGRHLNVTANGTAYHYRPQPGMSPWCWAEGEIAIEDALEEQKNP